MNNNIFYLELMSSKDEEILLQLVFNPIFKSKSGEGCFKILNQRLLQNDKNVSGVFIIICSRRQ